MTAESAAPAAGAAEVTQVAGTTPGKTPVRRSTKRQAAQGAGEAGATAEIASAATDRAERAPEPAAEGPTEKRPPTRPAKRRSSEQIEDADNAAESAAFSSGDTQEVVALAGESPTKCDTADDIDDADATGQSSVAADDGDEETEDAEETAAGKHARARFKLERLKAWNVELSWPKVMAFGVLPCLVLLLAAAASYLKWQAFSIRVSQTSSIESVAAAKDATTAMLSYQPDTVEKDLGAARDRLTGSLKDSYTQLTHDVVIPGAKQQHVAAVATVPAAASVSANANHAVALVFVNQTTVIGTDPPSAMASTVRVTLNKVGGRWLISGFDPV